jgi:hypothetical protein
VTTVISGTQERSTKDAVSRPGLVHHLGVVTVLVAYGT